MTAIAIANRFLSIEQMSHLRVQRLSYIAYGRYMAVTGKSLCDEKPISFESGPGFLTIYRALSSYGHLPIKKPIEDEFGEVEMLGYRCPVVNEIISEVMELYGNMDPDHLAQVCCLNDGAWYNARQKTPFGMLAIMGDSEIVSHFRMH
ncbi:type II toxin-antitoxin system antitoxin SocA domain-containing protein [Salipiger sp. PrR003]|uniref:type II toxin-antitoxin system antitoxin SocA domain-containing protein n=1 Tax=Salipiger sp. PrR003 TaxID=2706776 RepID=UPI0013DC1400|nr:type II toxin-antitoxin system antitoxin SocA domain-containing protein [Salipiger sp. PrR003]NDV50380.1 DUF4065 domain-containing protein [Salipiger sp. PrR003]